MTGIDKATNLILNMTDEEIKKSFDQYIATLRAMLPESYSELTDEELYILTRPNFLPTSKDE